MWGCGSGKAAGDLAPSIGEVRLRERHQQGETVDLPRAETWVAADGAESAGFVSLGVVVVVGDLFVSPRHRGGGIDRRLIRHAAELEGSLRLQFLYRHAQDCAFSHALGYEKVPCRRIDDQGLPHENANWFRGADRTRSKPAACGLYC